MAEKDNFALVPRPPSAVEKAEPGTKRILSGMVTDALVLAQAAEKERNLERRFIAAVEELAQLIRKAANEGVVVDGEFRKRYMGLRVLASGALRLESKQTREIEMKGYRYFWGKGGLTVNHHEAAKLWRIAAEQGSFGAQTNLALCFSYGKGVPQDHTEAAKWFRQAADRGSEQGQSGLGWCYANGHGVPQDHSEAVKWFQKAAEQGNLDAQNWLGVCYAKGEGVAQDLEQSFRWFRIASELDNPAAQFNLALCYLRGAGVTKDTLQAYKWLKLAAKEAKLGDSRATKQLAALSASMSVAELADGERAYEEYSKRKWS